MKIVAVSGGFDPLHIGHIRYIHEARKLGDYLMVILNNDNWLRAKKGFVFQTETERREILEALRDVNSVFISQHPENPADMSVVEELKMTLPNVFANGGDRVKEGDAQTTAETLFCEDHGIEAVFGIGGGKIQSSSDLVKRVCV